MLENFFGDDISRFFNERGTASIPAVNVAETSNSFRIEVAAPGMRREDFKVNIEDNVLTISAGRKTSSEVNLPGEQPRSGAKAESPGSGVRAQSAQETDKSKTENQAMINREASGDSESYMRREFSYSSFTRSFTLPANVDPENIQASYKDGVLSLTIPKKEEKRNTKEIRIE
jgi:HSP20 family protein